MNEFHFAVGPEAAGQRLDQFLADQSAVGITRTRAQKLIAAGHCTVHGRAVRPSWRLEAGDEVYLRIPDPEPSSDLLLPEPIPLDVIFEDDDVVVINKPRGLVVHPAAGHWRGTLVNALLDHIDDEEFEGIGGEGRPGIVHRLDKDTTGLMVVAKNDQALNHLAGQIRERAVKREYLAIVHGSPETRQGRIEAPIGRHPVDRRKMAVNLRNGKEAVTHFRVLEPLDGYCLLACRLETGRTHQIRVHMAFIGHPIAGDRVYGPRKRAPMLEAQALHAHRLAFHHPRSGEWVEFTAPPPEDFKRFLAYLRQQQKATAGGNDA